MIQKTDKTDVLEQKNSGMTRIFLMKNLFKKKLQMFPPVLCSRRVLRAGAVGYRTACPCSTKLSSQCQCTEAGRGTTPQSHSCLHKDR